MEFPKECPTCKRSSVSTKTWSMLMQQDLLIKSLQDKLKKIKLQTVKSIIEEIEETAKVFEINGSKSEATALMLLAVSIKENNNVLS